MRYGWSLAVQPYCLKGQVVCGTVYGEMHLNDLLGSFVRVGYRLSQPDTVALAYQSSSTTTGLMCADVGASNVGLESIIFLTHNKSLIL